MMETKHDLKVTPEHFEALVRGEKRAEVRYDDRGYAAGDVLRLREYESSTNTYTGRETAKRITHILRGGQYGIEPGYVVLSVADIGAP
jgi:hypothetical protein